MNKNRLSVLLIAFAIGTSMFVTAIYVLYNSNTVYASTISQELQPLTSIDYPANNATISSSFNIVGWALNVSGVKEVDIFIDGVDKGTATLGTSRPDVYNAYKNYNSKNSGYNYTVAFNSIGSGDHMLEVKAIGNDGSVKTNTVSINKLPLLLSVDSPTNDKSVSNPVGISGWALNPSGVKEVDILVDGVEKGTATLNASRVDVYNAYKDYNNVNSGYNYKLDLSTASYGKHNIEVKAIGTDGTSIDSIKSITLTKLKSIVDIDTPNTGSVVGSNFTIAGWALDSSGVSQVQIYCGSKLLGNATVGGSRADVDKAYPAYNTPNSGYSFPVDITSLVSGNNTLTVKSTGTDGTVATNNVVVNVPASIMCLDTPTSNEVLKSSTNQLSINGWSLNAFGVKQVQILVDGVVKGDAILNIPRQDVFNAYKVYDNENSGFSYNLDLTSMTSGKHAITVNSIGTSGSTTKSCTVTNPAITVTSVGLNKSTDAILTGNTDSLTSTVFPVDAVNAAVTWTTSNSNVATVTNGVVTTVSAGTASITAATADGCSPATCTITVTNPQGYVNNVYLNVRSAPNLDASNTPIGCVYNYDSVQILGTVNDTIDGTVWDKIVYANSVGYAYVSSAYIEIYTTPPVSVVNIAANITGQFEVGSGSQISGNADGQGLSLGYLQWCIGEGTLQPLLNRMDSEYNSEMVSIFGANYTSVHAMLQGSPSYSVSMG